MGKQSLDDCRKGIAQIDDEIIGLLIKRFSLTDEVGRIKKKDNIPIENLDVEKKILARLIGKTDDDSMRVLIAKIYPEIFNCSKERQRKF